MGEKYYLGLDIGTNSVGFALTNENYKVINKNGKSLWGVHLFDEAQTQKERRTFRNISRRRNRQKQRIGLLQYLLNDEVMKVDANFFKKLNTSFCKIEDRDNGIKYNLFNDANFTDKDFYKKYPTIYHLRKDLISSNEKKDIRLIYLALHHMLKYRGHFTYEGKKFNLDDISIQESFEKINAFFDDKDVPFEQFSFFGKSENELKQEIFKVKGILKTCEAFNDFFEIKEKMNKEIIRLISGGKVNAMNIFSDVEEKYEISFSDEKYEEQALEMNSKIGEENADLIIICKEIYDFVTLKRLLGNSKDDQSNYLSYAMVNKYEKHCNDLKVLKKFVKENYADKYATIFRDKNKNNNYPNYIGSNMTNQIKDTLKHCKVNDFYSFLKSNLNIKAKESEYFESILEDMETNDYLPRLNSSKNSTLPYQLNEIEMKKILENQAPYYPFLLKKDQYGTTIDKILSLLTFRIPYYVGPLNKNSKFAWIVRNDEKIFPWNFENVVDLDASAYHFIKRMTNKCTYLFNEETLPKNSLIYSEYLILNELNKLCINGKLIDYDIKMDLLENLFKKQKKITIKNVKTYLENKFSCSVELTTSNNKEFRDFGNSLSSYISFKEVFGDDFDKNIDSIEEIINEITIFEDKNVLEKRLFKIYGLKEEQVKKIKSFNFKGWGKFSKKLLVGLKTIVNINGEEVEKSILDILRETNSNFMEIINSPNYSFSKMIVEENETDEKINKEYIEKLPTSPANKRGIIKSLKIVKELIGIVKHPIDKIFVETTRNSKDSKSKETASRKKDLETKYLSVENFLSQIADLDFKELQNSLSIKDSKDLKSKKLYLYFTQLGRCMYSLEKISLERLFTADYDIDHIVPQSLIKDDSFDNLVLVKREKNDSKKDEYPIPTSILNPDCKKFWYFLCDKGALISKDKLAKLTRRSELTDDELQVFVNRQLVATSQITKYVIEILSQLYPNTEIVWSKANLVSDFRNRDNVQFLKCRETNDFHHAHDAYLNVVVGNTAHTKFPPSLFIAKKAYQTGPREKLHTANIKKIFDHPVCDSNGVVVWDNGKVLTNVLKQLSHQDVMVTYAVKPNRGQLFKQTILSPNEKNDKLIPLKGKGLLSNKKYGGYTSLNFGYYCIVESTNKNKRKYSFEAIPLLVIQNKNMTVESYLENSLGLINPKIIVDKIYNGFIFRRGKFEFTIRGSEDRACATQMRWDKTDENYLRIVLKFVEEMGKKANGISNFNEIEEYHLHDSIYTEKDLIVSKKDNLKIYEKIITMLSRKIFENYSIFNNLKETMISKQEKFESLTLIQQCIVLKNLLVIQHCNPACGDLSLLGETKDFGRFRSKKLEKGQQLLTKSITGYYEKIIWEYK